VTGERCYVVASQRPWNAELAQRLAARTGERIVAIHNADDLVVEKLDALRPRFVFIAHWSSRIPDAVWSAHECVIFHMTDVPYGRGGSPLQNLIVRGHRDTQLSALRCVRELDAGPVYLKRPLSLEGSAGEIFVRADRLIEEMICDIVRDEPVPVEQLGEPVMFKRRRPEDGNLRQAATLENWYDFIRMLDAEGYPRAFLDVSGIRLEFSKVRRDGDRLIAEVVLHESTKEKAS
jgi:methionyl-tRNA formyltransferase